MVKAMLLRGGESGDGCCDEVKVGSDGVIGSGGNDCDGDGVKCFMQGKEGNGMGQAREGGTENLKGEAKGKWKTRKGRV